MLNLKLVSLVANRIFLGALITSAFYSVNISVICLSLSLSLSLFIFIFFNYLH